LNFEKEITFNDTNILREIFGSQDKNLKRLEKALSVRISVRESHLTVTGSEKDCSVAENLLRQLYESTERGLPVGKNDFSYILSVVERGETPDLKSMLSLRIPVAPGKGYVSPQTFKQREYIQAIEKEDVVIGIGPAGTGKTYLAMAKAVSALLEKKYNRIILTRPAVEAGEKLGFLPGDMVEKINPYLRPLYDALYDMVDFERAAQMVEKGLIEIAPLAFMRGRTLNDCFIILDEAQNATTEQIKMFLTRMGYHSKVVVTGDITQIDLPTGKRSGLVEIQEVLHEVEGISFVYFDEKDVVRHRLVQQIVKAYERHQLTRVRSNQLD
jgi:phosphate starvation-inducible PhoH-like protein